MIDPRITKLADVLVNYSCEVKPGEKVLIECIDIPQPLTVELIRLVAEAKGLPLATLKSNRVNRMLYRCASEEQMKLIAEAEALRMRGVQCYIGVRGTLNVSELSDVPADKMKLYENLLWRPVHSEIRVRKTRWVVLRYPSGAMAQQAQMSTDAFEDFYFDVCTMDYRKMSSAMRPLADLMMKTDRVHIKGPGTDLTLSIKGIPAIPCDGKLNIPDGEVFTAPVRDSVNGTIQFNTPTIYRGVTHENVRLTFRDGKIVEACSNATEALNQVFNSDPGARYVGEFALGFNPFITRPMKDILFDEKIAGSFHLTPGNAYDEADNGNKSQIHWDMVMMQDKNHGGGEIHFDGKLVRKDGLFVIPALEPLNPDKLGARP